MNRQQRHAAGKGQPNERVEVTGFVAHFANGQYANLDIKKVAVIDKETGRPLFDEVLDVIDAQPQTPHQEFKNEQDEQSYTVAFDTPEGKMEYIKKGNWSGVRSVKE